MSFSDTIAFTSLSAPEGGLLRFDLEYDIFKLPQFSA